MSNPQNRRKLMAYVDGFNLYFGLLKSRPDLRWLNVREMVRISLPDDEVIGVKFFTASVDETAGQSSAGCSVRQQTYWNALRSAGVEIVEGRHEYREHACRVAHCSLPRPTWFRRRVEKMTDVNLALHLVEDTRVMQPGAIVVISGDSDLLPALRRVRDLAPKALKQVLIPASAESMRDRRLNEISQLGWLARRLDERTLASAQFPPTVSWQGMVLSKPNPWIATSATPRRFVGTA